MRRSVNIVGYVYGTRNAVRVLVAVGLLWSATGPVLGQEGSNPPPVATAKQKHFATPEAAVEALAEAFKNEDESALLDIFGHDHEKLVVVTDKVARREAIRELGQRAREMNKLEREGENKCVIVLGHEAWPFPIPIVKDPAGWRFDTDAGEEEILNRRVGENELDAIANCRTYVTAQVEYAGMDRDGDQVLEYAQRIKSTTGKKDGLYWPVDPAGGEELSPFGPLVAEAAAYLEAGGAGTRPFKGYYYRILTRQGENPPGGKYDYVINGNMIAGFALVACPADYGASGIMTFLVSHQGKVFEKDLGEKTHEMVKSMDEYNPDQTWTLVEN